jgi:hypothetical protein
MKLTSRRFGRQAAHEDVDEGMGGGDYPTIVNDQPIVIPDLSVESDLQVIPEQIYPELTPDPEVPAYGAEEDFWGNAGNAPEKASRRRPRRGSRSLGVVDYPSVGSDVAAPPVVIPDLSVEQDLQIIPDPAEPAVTLIKEPPRDGGTDFWTEIGTEPEKAPRPWWRRKATWVTATILFTVAAVALSLIAISGPAVKNKRISYTFPVEAFPQTGVTVSRVWTLYGGAHPSLHGDLTFYSTRADAVTVEELLPASLVTKASQVTFIPQPKIVSEQDPVIASYTISSAISGVTAVEYNVPLAAGTKFDLTTLHKWATDQAAEQGKRYLASHTLASIHLTPPSIVVKKDGPAYQLAISGLLNDKSAAPTIAFGTATWSVANPKIAKVSTKGQVTGLGVGRTTVRATVGKLSATATVTVSEAAKVRTTPPLKTLKPGPLPTGPNATPSSAGLIIDPTNPATNPPVVTTHPVTPPVHNPPPVVVPPVNPPPPPACTFPAPSQLQAASFAVGQLTVTWADPSAAGCTLQGVSVSVTDSAGATFSQPVGPLVGSATFGGLAGGAASVSATASYGTNNSAAVGTSGSVQAPPPPVCNPATQDFGPTALAAVANDPTAPDSFTISWTPASVAVGSPCAVASEVATVDGVGVTNGQVLLLAPGPHTLIVTATFADGTVAAPQFPFTAP